eukprot:gene15388-biopygen16819
MEDQQQQSQPVPVNLVLQTIRAAMSHNHAERAPAESALRGWEADAAPGFLHSLMLIVHEAGAIDEPTRLLATVIAKKCCRQQLEEDTRHQVRSVAGIQAKDPHGSAGCCLACRQTGLLLAGPAKAWLLLLFGASAAASQQQQQQQQLLKGLLYHSRILPTVGAAAAAAATRWHVLPQQLDADSGSNSSALDVLPQQHE